MIDTEHQHGMVSQLYIRNPRLHCGDMIARYLFNHVSKLCALEYSFLFHGKAGTRKGASCLVCCIQVRTNRAHHRSGKSTAFACLLGLFVMLYKYAPCLAH